MKQIIINRADNWAIRFWPIGSEVRTLTPPDIRVWLRLAYIDGFNDSKRLARAAAKKASKKVRKKNV